MTEDFRNDINSGNLPQVSLIVAPEWLSEHAIGHPADGMKLSADLIGVLAANKTVYSKTAFILNYDEGGQFFDHHWIPTPPVNDTDGKSNVPVTGEITTEAYYSIPAGNPIGLGFRVPLIIVSPWTRGGYVYSGVADHTSTLKFVERRFGINVDNISPWRREITSDLVEAFNFTHPDYSWPSNLPDTSGNWNESQRQCDNLPPPEVPREQHMPKQDRGTKKSRALPYNHDASLSFNKDSK